MDFQKFSKVETIKNIIIGVKPCVCIGISVFNSFVGLVYHLLTNSLSNSSKQLTILSGFGPAEL